MLNIKELKQGIAQISMEKGLPEDKI